MFLHYHSTNSWTNQPRNKPTNQLREQKLSLKNTRHFWNPSVVFTRTRHLAKWNLQTISRTFSLTSATTQVPKAMLMILFLSNKILIQLVKIHTRFGTRSASFFRVRVQISETSFFTHRHGVIFESWTLFTITLNLRSLLPCTYTTETTTYNLLTELMYVMKARSRLSQVDWPPTVQMQQRGQVEC